MIAKNNSHHPAGFPPPGVTKSRSRYRIMSIPVFVHQDTQPCVTSRHFADGKHEGENHGLFQSSSRRHQPAKPTMPQIAYDLVLSHPKASCLFESVISPTLAE